MKSKGRFTSIFFRVLKVFLLLMFSAFILAAFATWNSFSFLQKQDFGRTEAWAGVAKFIVAPARIITEGRIAELVIWDEGLNLLYNSEGLVDAVKILADVKPATLEEKVNAHEVVRLTMERLPRWGGAFHNSKLFDVRKIIPSNEPFFWFYIIEDIWASEKPWLVLLQNTDEVRATGGFIGSYAEIWFTPEKLGEIEIRDIYDPDGLIFTKLSSPPGQKEYLSAGKGLRLPDANWDADFPTSARRISWFLLRVENNPRDYQGVVAINLSLVEELIGVFGEIEVAGLDQALTKENFSTLARESRTDFFAGSRQKTQFLDQAMVALKSRVQQMNKEEARRLVNVLFEATQNKDLQFYSGDKEIMEYLNQLGVTGKIGFSKSNEPVFYVVPIESNVGINKANRLVTREFCYQNRFEEVELTYVFHNANQVKDRPTEEDLVNADHNLSPHLGYVNYQRFLLSPSDQVGKIVWDGKEIKNWSSRLITIYGGEMFKEIGFLLKLPEESSARLTVIIEPGEMLDEDSEIIMEPQSGVEYLECADTR